MNDSKGPMVAAVDLAFSAFERQVPTFRNFAELDLSESDTRSKVIDPILELLGWRETSIRREWHDKVDGKYLDYKLATTQPIFVVEAKKTFVHFEIPSGHGRFFRIGGAIKNAANLSAVINQARQYAINSGLVYCCVTNGFSFVFFRASNTLGVSWDQQLVVVFRDHNEILCRFSEFFELFSYESVSTGRFNEALPVKHVSANETSRFRRFGSELKVDYETRDRNALFPYTRELIKRIFQSLDNDDASPDLLEHCYVESARDSSYERGIGELLREHRTKIPNGATKVITKRKDAGEFQGHFEKLADQPAQFGNVTLLLGTVGAGKTTFLNRFRKVFARELIDSSFVWVQISFNTFVESEDRLADWVNDQIKSCLRENYGDINPFAWDALQVIYRKEIAELKEGVLNPLFQHDQAKYEIALAERIDALSKHSDSHLLKCLKYYSQKSRRQIILAFDNADQHSPMLQNDAFLLAQKYSQMLRCIAFISLREESYWKNKEIGGLSAFHSTAFQINAPRIEQVLAKRFKYASKMILEDRSIVAAHFASSDLKLNAEQIDNIFRTLQITLLGEDKRFIRFLEYTSPGEVRRSLDFVARFMTSGHTNVNRIMHRSQGGRVAPVGFHEFIQAVMLGDRKHYREDLSDVVNFFATDGKGDRSHFNRLAIISRALSAIGDSSDRGNGFVPIIDVIHDCEAIGITAETVAVVIGKLVEKRLLASDTLIRDKFSDGSYIRVTSAALYYANELAPDFTYLDNIIIDTEIGSDDVRRALSDLSRAIFSELDRFKKLEYRIERARQFVRYLHNEFEASSLRRASDKFDLTGRTLVKKIFDQFPAQADRILSNARDAFKRS